MWVVFKLYPMTPYKMSPIEREFMRKVLSILIVTYEVPLFPPPDFEKICRCYEDNITPEESAKLVIDNKWFL